MIKNALDYLVDGDVLEKINTRYVINDMVATDEVFEYIAYTQAFGILKDVVVGNRPVEQRLKTYPLSVIDHIIDDIVDNDYILPDYRSQTNQHDYLNNVEDIVNEWIYPSN